MKNGAGRDLDEDLYSILNLDKDATQDEIKAHYKKLARYLHPDKIHSSEKENKASEEIYLKVSFAYKVLSSEVQRKIYDKLGIEGINCYLREIDEASFRNPEAVNIDFSTLENSNNSKSLAIGKYDKLAANIMDRVVGRVFLEREIKEQEVCNVSGIVQASFDASGDLFRMNEVQIQQSVSAPLNQNHKFGIAASGMAVSLLRKMPVPDMDSESSPVSGMATFNNLFLGDAAPAPVHQKIVSQNAGLATLKFSHEWTASQLTTVETDLTVSSNYAAPTTVETKMERVLSPILTATILASANLSFLRYPLSTTLDEESSTGLKFELERKLLLDSSGEYALSFKLGQGSLSDATVGVSRKRTYFENLGLREKLLHRRKVLNGSLPTESFPSHELSKPQIHENASVGIVAGGSPGILFNFLRGYSYNSRYQSCKYTELNNNFLTKYSSNIYHKLYNLATVLKLTNFFNVNNVFALIDRVHGTLNEEGGLPGSLSPYTAVYSFAMRVGLVSIDVESGIESRSIPQDYGFSLLLSTVRGLFLNVKFRRKQLNFIFPLKLLSLNQMVHFINTFEIVSENRFFGFSWSVFGLLKLLIVAKGLDFCLEPLLSWFQLQDSNFWVKREIKLREKRKQAMEQRSVMEAVLESKNASIDSKVSIIIARYGTELHKRFTWDELGLPQLEEFSMMRSRRPSDWEEPRNESLLSWPKRCIKNVYNFCKHFLWFAEDTITTTGKVEAGELVESHPDNIDVTVQLQFFLRNGDKGFRLPQSTKQNLLGFYNPLHNRKEKGVPRLFVRYSFYNQVYEATFEDVDPIEIPSSKAVHIGALGEGNAVDWAKIE